MKNHKVIIHAKDINTSTVKSYRGVVKEWMPEGVLIECRPYFSTSVMFFPWHVVMRIEDEGVADA